jgi:hypothetical protein
MFRLQTWVLEEGLEYLANPKPLFYPSGERAMVGKPFPKVLDEPTEYHGHHCTAIRNTLFKNGQLSCCKCGIKGTHWHVERGIKDEKSFFQVNLYAMRGYEERMLTLDHIIPRSWGGADSVENGQIMCSYCNFRKKDSMLLSEIIQIDALNPALWSDFVPVFRKRQKNLQAFTIDKLIKFEDRLNA